MIRKLTTIFLYILAIIGLVDSTYLAYSKLTARPLICDIIDGCNIVAASPHSFFMGIPLSFWGIAFYLAILLAIWSVETYAHFWIYRSLVVLATVGALMSMYFVYLQFFVINAVCIYCLISATISVVLLPLTIWHITTERESLKAV